jgi:hypothetical protein
MKTAILASAALGLVLCASAFAQTGPADKAAPAYDHTKPYPAYTAPRLGNGQPDLQGFWSNATLTTTSRPGGLGERLAYTEEEVAKIENARVEEVAAGLKPTDVKADVEYRAPGTVNAAEAAAGGAVGTYNGFWKDPGNAVMRVNGQPRTSIITTPTGRPPAAKPGSTALQTTTQPAFFKLLGDSPTPKGGSFENPESRGFGERCIISFGRNGGPPMFANGWYNNNYQLVQSASAVMIVTEMNHDARIVRLNAKHRADDVRPYFGDSIGWFEGDTLVVETDHIPQTQAYSGAWKNLKVTEKFKRVAEDRLLYSFQVEDKTIWDTAWGGEYEFYPVAGQRMYEYACHEGNYALHGILSGARVQEAKKVAADAAAAAKAKPGKAKPAKSGKQ